jgi:hypothetical protein
MIMYGDIILKFPEILDLIPKDIVLMDWQYEPADHYPTVDVLGSKGFPILVLPGMSNWDRIFPDMSKAMINIRNFTLDCYRQPHPLGSITSTWGDNGSKNLRELIPRDERITNEAKKAVPWCTIPVLKASGGLCLDRWQIAPPRLICSQSQSIIGLEELMDLARPLIDHCTLAVAVEAADRVLVRVAVRAVNLDRVARGTLRGDGGERCGLQR